MNKLKTFFHRWGRKSLGTMLREWWNYRPPNPWPDELQKEIEGPDAVHVCHRCLTPQEHLGWFCPKCGAATGPYNNSMAYVYIFSVGEVLRLGVNKKSRFAKWVYPAYFLVGIAEYFIFAPVYWFRLINASKKRRQQKLPIEDEFSL